MTEARPEVAGDGRCLAVLEPTVRAYAWGSRTFLAGLRGRPVPSAEPEAELWFGAHPSGPAVLQRAGAPVPLDVAIAADPVGELGTRHAASGRLPFLVKLLAADAPLSIQVHPDAAAAAAGFAAEEAAGVPRDAAARRFPDPWAKPEVLVALTPVRARCGLRALDDLAPTLAALAPTLVGRGDAGALVRDLLGRSAVDAAALVADATAAAERVADDAPLGVRQDAATLRELAARYPGDVGCLVALLLVPVALAPGEALVVPPGTLHAYLEGAGLEVMGASDNVLRAGLTSKHVDRAALLEVADLVAAPPSRPATVADGAWHRSAPLGPDVAHARADLGPDAQDLAGGRPPGPAIVVCTAGTVTLIAGGDRVVLGAGQGAFVSARASGLVGRGPGTLHRVGAA